MLSPELEKKNGTKTVLYFEANDVFGDKQTYEWISYNHINQPGTNFIRKIFGHNFWQIIYSPSCGHVRNYSINMQVKLKRIFTLWSPAGKGLTSWLSFVVPYCEFVIFPLVFLVRCGTWLYRFQIFAPLLTLPGGL